MAINKLPRFVELVRVSTQGQSDLGTPESQKRALDALRKRRPGIFVERIDSCVSGAAPMEERADLRRLMALAKARAFDELRVFSVDRLSRSSDPRERFAVFGVVADAGARIVEANGNELDPADPSGAGEITFFFSSYFAAAERKKILARTAAGRLRAAEDGHLSQGSPPFGRVFNHVMKRWEVVPEQVAVYKRIVQEILDGRSTREVAARLDGDGVPPARGHRWAHSSIKRLLKAPSIIGKYTPCGHPTEIPAIISEAEWDKVRAALRRNASTLSGPTRTRPALLRGVLRCAACGRTVHVLSDGQGAIHRYGCPKPSQRASLCPNRRTIQVPAADASVRTALLRMVMDSAALTKAIRLHDASAAKSDPREELKRAEKDLVKLDARMARTLRLMDGELLPEASGVKELEDIKAARTDAEARKRRAEVAAGTVSVLPTTKVLMKAAREMGAALKAASVERLAQLLRILVPEEEPFGVRLTPAGIEIVGRLPLGLTEDRHLATIG